MPFQVSSYIYLYRIGFLFPCGIYRNISRQRRLSVRYVLYRVDEFLTVNIGKDINNA